MAKILDQHPSIASQFISELRDVHIQKDRLRFRRNMERIGEIMAYEMSKTFLYTSKEVDTPLGTATMSLSDQRLVIASILRAGLPFHNGFLNYFDYADNAFISAYRKHHKDGSFEIALEYVSCPDLEGSTLIVVDPMLATGASMQMTIKELLRHGQPDKIHLGTIIASTAGLDFIERIFPSVSIWIGALDEELTAKSYIVPGLGDAGDLAYGPKVQS